MTWSSKKKAKDARVAEKAEEDEEDEEDEYKDYTLDPGAANLRRAPVFLKSISRTTQKLKRSGGQENSSLDSCRDSCASTRP